MLGKVLVVDGAKRNQFVGWRHDAILFGLVGRHVDLAVLFAEVSKCLALHGMPVGDFGQFGGKVAAKLALRSNAHD